MEILLTEDVEKLGQQGDTVKVKPGYARNYLLPSGKGVVPTPQMIQQVEKKRRIEEERRLKERADLEAMAAKFKDLSVTVSAQVGEDEETLYGGISPQMIVEQLKEEHNIEVGGDKVIIEEAIKTIGTFPVEVSLGHGVTASIKVWVVPSD